ncbi:MAG: hypothetical protein IKR88_03825 [Bacteroidales bacterium]|nr:hypothetical protein [Bacteroidales bacterium]
MMDKYIRVARVYPAVLGMLPLCILLTLCLEEWFPQYNALIVNMKRVPYLVISSTVLSTALGYFVRELFKDTSKWLFQYPMFKMDETEMPSTKMLLWGEGTLSPAYHTRIAVKVRETFGTTLPTYKEEQADSVMAKKRIAEIVSLIRQHCRGNKILEQYNMEFGFCRNYLGAGVWSILLITILSVVNIFHDWLPWQAIIVAFVAQVLLMMACFCSLKVKGRTYATYLYATFVGETK